MFLDDERATDNLGEQLAHAVSRVQPRHFVIYLVGDLGAGKTCLARGLIHGFGHAGRVKSPTYTIVEPYELSDKKIYHLDLYRMSDPEELEYLGIRDMSQSNAIMLVEWPERGERALPAPDLEIKLAHAPGQVGRDVSLRATSEQGKAVLGALSREQAMS